MVRVPRETWNVIRLITLFLIIPPLRYSEMKCAMHHWHEIVNKYLYFFKLIFYLITVLMIMTAQLDTIALLISDFFLATFALMNFCTFHICLVKPVGWRPTFKVIPPRHIQTSQTKSKWCETVLQHVAEPVHVGPVRGGHVPDQLAGGAHHLRHRPLLLPVRCLQETR